MIAIVDYGMGNVHSVAKALQKVAEREQVVLTRDPAVIRKADRIVVPGQGAMPDCMRELEQAGVREAVIEAARQKPFLGICIGLQMLFELSEEGPTLGLNLLPGRVQRFAHPLLWEGKRLKVPHMGWNEVDQTRPHALWNAIADQSRFYFVHSYYALPSDSGLVFGTACYPTPFTCAVAQANIFAVQFHPEKSQRAGLQLLANFIAWDGHT